MSDEMCSACNGYIGWWPDDMACFCQCPTCKAPTPDGEECGTAACDDERYAYYDNDEWMAS